MNYHRRLPRLSLIHIYLLAGDGIFHRHSLAVHCHDSFVGEIDALHDPLVNLSFFHKLSSVIFCLNKKEAVPNTGAPPLLISSLILFLSLGFVLVLEEVVVEIILKIVLKIL